MKRQMSDWFVTASGRRMFVRQPVAGDITIEDIAHGLSHVCRFGGHTRTFYPVAAHSIMVSEIVPARYALEGLLHDATEAYLGDIIRPLKAHLPEYKKLERAWANAIAYRFGVKAGMPAEVKRADMVALATERRDLMIVDKAWPYADWDQEEPLAGHIQIATPEQWRRRFIHRYRSLLNRGGQ